MVTPIVTELRRHGQRLPGRRASPAKAAAFEVLRSGADALKRMSIEAVLSRIDVIAQAQQQLASPVGSTAAANAGAIGATLNGSAAATTGASPSTTFATALAQAQGTTGSTPPSTSTHRA